MTYLLDTNVWIRYFAGKTQSVIDAFERANTEEIALCSIVVAELRYGRRKGQWASALIERQDAFLSKLACYPVDSAVAEIAGDLRADLERLGTPIGPHDLLIAATTLAHDLTLVTHNVREFGRIPGLRVEDWESAG